MSVVIILGVVGNASAAFNPTVVKAKINDLKTQMTKVLAARTTALAAKNSLDSVLTPYKQYSATSTVVADGIAKVNGFTIIDAPYTPLMTYDGVTFAQAYDAYFLFNAQKMAKDLSDAVSVLKVTASSISSLITKRTAAQDLFKEVVAGVAKPAFLGS